MLRQQGQTQLVKKYTIQHYSEYSGKVEKRGFTPIANIQGYSVGFGHTSKQGTGTIFTNLNKYDNLATNWIIGVDTRLIDKYNQIDYSINKLELVDKYVRYLDSNIVMCSGLFIVNETAQHTEISKNNNWYKVFADAVYLEMVKLNY